MLVGGRGREDQHVVATRSGQEFGVEDAARRPLGSPDQRQQTRLTLHGRHFGMPTAWRPTPGRELRLPLGKLKGMTTIATVGILGSGIMGSGIAEVAAAAGHEVVLRSRSQAAADAMVGGLEESLSRQVEKGKRTEAERDAILARVTATTDLADLAAVDLVIESVVEDLAVKKQLFAELDRIVCDDAHHPGHQHLDPAGGRAGHGDRPARQGLRGPLLQPGPGHVAGRGGAADHRRPTTRSPPPWPSPRPAARSRSR